MKVSELLNKKEIELIQRIFPAYSMETDLSVEENYDYFFDMVTEDEYMNSFNGLDYIPTPDTYIFESISDKLVDKEDVILQN